jgi:hypothetical protein
MSLDKFSMGLVWILALASTPQIHRFEYLIGPKSLECCDYGCFYPFITNQYSIPDFVSSAWSSLLVMFSISLFDLLSFSFPRFLFSQNLFFFSEFLTEVAKFLAHILS